MTYFSKQEQWLKIAENLTPKLLSDICKPVSVVEIVKNEKQFQGWEANSIGSPNLVLGVLQPRTFSFVLDFGKHIVGQLQLKIGLNEYAADAPLRLKLVFGEVPAEIGEPFEPYEGDLSRSWLQDEIITLDELPCEFTTPRRYAFRYLKIQVENSSPWHQIKFEEIACKTITSANYNEVTPLNPKIAKEWQAIDEVSLRTLANCMHTVFEDGPKRDRRLWVGDLRLQAQANYLTFKNNDLVKRCLYLYAGLANDEGKIMVDLYERPIVRRGNSYLMDYGALFSVILFDYYEATKDSKTTKDLWPAALRQFDFITSFVNDDGLFDSPATTRIFIDWCVPLHRQGSMHAILIYALRRTIKLASAIGEEKSVSLLTELLNKMVKAAHKNFFDKTRQVWVSGPDKQVSFATWAWMVLAEVSANEEAKQSFQALSKIKDTIKPNGPYLYHHVVDALLSCGLQEEAKIILKDYWGGMITKGATTFWEIYDPNNDKLAPYASYHTNSHCHAWSCTPTYFIRKYFS